MKNSGAGVRIAVLDTGIDWSHPMLSGLQQGEDVEFEASANSTRAVPSERPDPFGHGTAVASIIRRLAPDISLGSIRVLAGDARGSSAVVHEGAKYAIESGYHVLHCSFGSPLTARVSHFKAWLDQAYVKGVSVVGASSNRGATRMDYPSHFPSVIGVSGRGNEGTYTLKYLDRQLIQLSLPADDFHVAWCQGATNVVGGTSFVAPIVTALSAKLLQAWPDASPLELKALIIRLAKEGLDLTEMLVEAGIVDG